MSTLRKQRHFNLVATRSRAPFAAVAALQAVRRTT
jgi:hypothetical protein